MAGGPRSGRFQVEGEITVRRLLVTAALVPVLVFALAGQALAVISPGTEKTLATTNETCDSTGCLRTLVNAYTYTDGTAEVYASQVLFDTNLNGIWEYWGHSPVDPSTLTYDSRGFLVAIPTTSIDQVELLYGVLPPRTVSVSISTHTSGRIRTESYRSTDTDGTCTYKITQKDQMVAAVGTLTQDTTTLAANFYGQSFITDYTVRQQCPH
jgi:hypothetical protein